MGWKDLSVPQKAELIRIGVKAGIGLKQLQSLYDEQQSIEGVIKEEQTINNNRNVQQQDPSVYMEELIKEAKDAYRKYSQGINDTIYNPSRDNPPFIQRILNNDKRSVKDWQNEGYYSTHKLSYAQTPEGFVVYPDVQDINGQLHDFTDPKYNHGKWDALDSAIQRGDTLVFPTEQKAMEYTETYKTLYPEYFNQFNNGGYVNKFALGGPKKRKKENSLAWRQAVYNGVDPRGTVKSLGDAMDQYFRANTKYKRNDNTKNYELDGSLGDYVTDAAWRKRLQLPYDDIYLPVWNGDTVSLPRELEMEIPIDTNLVKQRIEYAKQEALKDFKDFKFRDAVQDLRYKKTQDELLKALRYTYATGKPIGISEYHSNSINPEDVLSTFSYGKTPLNVLGRYNIRYDKDENKMYYSDEWDFNQFEWAVPGTSFRIRGAIPLPGNKKYGGYIFPKGVFEKI